MKRTAVLWMIVGVSLAAGVLAGQGRSGKVMAVDPNAVEWLDLDVLVNERVEAVLADPNGPVCSLVKAEVSLAVSGLKTGVDPNALSAAIAASEARTWQRMVQADQENAVLIEREMAARAIAELQAWLAE